MMAEEETFVDETAGHRLADPHVRTEEEVLGFFQTRKTGLTAQEVADRLALYGENEIPEAESVSPFQIIINQFKSWLVIILLIAAGISLLTSQYIDVWVILFVVFVNAGIGFSQEYRAERAIAALRKMIVKYAKVVRDGELQSLPSNQLVPGDIIVLEEGDSIPADARIIEAKNLRTAEASLTGESVPNSKQTAILPKETPLADRENMLWKGTFVVTGYGKAIVTGTGTHTAIGEISTSLELIDEQKTNFMRKTDVLARQMSVVAVASATLIFLVGYLIRDFAINEMLLIGIAALVAAVPEGLPAVISVVLAIGAKRMSKRKAIIREFAATETLGAITAILTDKTGTLTRNTLTVRKVFISGLPEYTVSGEGWFPAGNFFQDDNIISVEQHPALKELLTIAAISNNAEIRSDPDSKYSELIGDPTEGALSVLARKGGLLPSSYLERRLDDLPFNADIKMRATLITPDEPGPAYLAMIGAPERILERATHLMTEEGEKPFTDELKEQMADKITDWSNEALRVIALAYKQSDAKDIEGAGLDHLVFAGVVGMIDPPRKDTRAAVEKCKQAGIRVIMVTGDHINTAVAIARACGIIEEDSESHLVALTEQQLERLSNRDFDQAISNVSVFARLTPKMKLRIAHRLQEMGHLIAMTGDGVNDAPALKGADVGIAMGIIGTDVARASSDVVLANDNFSTIVNAVEEGRIVFKNARQTSFFLITTNIAESVTLLLGIFLGLPLPLTATQILWLNLVTDGVTGLALATEPGHGDMMNEAPASKTEQILTKKVVPFLVINVLLMSALSLATFNYYLPIGLEEARSGAFCMMVFTQLFNVLNLRSVQLSVFTVGFFSNRYINLSLLFAIGLLIMVVSIPDLAAVLRFEPLPLQDFLVLFLLASSVLWAVEVYKALSSKFNRK